MRKKIQVSITKSEKRNVTKSTKKIVENFKLEIDQYYDENGFVSFSARSKKYTILGTNSPKEGICECPECQWPTVIFRYSRKQEWKRQCANMKCKTRS